MQHDLGLRPDPRHFFLSEDEAVSASVLLGWPREARADPAMAAALAASALHDWLTAGLPVHRDPAGTLRFDVAHMLNFMRALGIAGQDPVFLQRTVPIFRDAAAQTSAGRFRVQIVREFLSPRPGPVRLRVPLPFDDPTQTLLDASASADGPTRRLPHAFEAKLDGRPGTPLSMQVELLLHARPNDAGFADPGPSDPALYLNPSEGLVQVTPSVRRLAAKLATPGDLRATLRAFWEFFFDGRWRHGVVRHRELEPADPLAALQQLGWFDCFAASSLIVALCRARSVPARLVQGLVLHELAPAFHYWAEIHTEAEGWLSLDLASWDYAAGRLGATPWSDWFFLRLEPRMKLQCFPRRVTGPVGVPFPADWSIVRAPAPGGGVVTSVYDVARPSGAALAYRDTVRVEALDRPEAASATPNDAVIGRAARNA